MLKDNEGEMMSEVHDGKILSSCPISYFQRIDCVGLHLFDLAFSFYLIRYNVFDFFVAANLLI